MPRKQTDPRTAGTDDAGGFFETDLIAEEAQQGLSQIRAPAGLPLLEARLRAGIYKEIARKPDEKLRDADRMVALVNVSLKTLEETVFTERSPRGEKVRVEPTGVLPLMTVQQARDRLTPRNRPMYAFLTPDEGDCGGRQSFTAFGREWSTCTFSNCPRHQHPRGAQVSIYMMQHLIAYLERPEAIRYVANELDPREPVFRWASHHEARRLEEKRKRMGLAGTGNIGDMQPKKRSPVF